MTPLEDEVLSKHGHLVLKYKVPEDEGGVDDEFETFVATASLYSKLTPTTYVIITAAQNFVNYENESRKA